MCAKSAYQALPVGGRVTEWWCPSDGRTDTISYRPDVCDGRTDPRTVRPFVRPILVHKFRRESLRNFQFGGNVLPGARY